MPNSILFCCFPFCARAATHHLETHHLPSVHLGESTQFDEQMSAEERRLRIANLLIIKHVILEGCDSKKKNSQRSIQEIDLRQKSIPRVHRDDCRIDNAKSPALQYSPPGSVLPVLGADEVHATNKLTSNASSSRAVFHRLKSDIMLSDSYRVDEDIESAQNDTLSVCAICLTPYKAGDEICWSINPGCQHAFHHSCIEAWLLKHVKCPICRSNYLESDVTITESVAPSSQDESSPTSTDSSS